MKYEFKVTRFREKQSLTVKSQTETHLAKAKISKKPKTHQKAKTVVKSSVKWDAGTGKCSFMSIFGVLVATGPNCFIVLWKILVLWKLIYRSISWLPKGCKNSQNNADKVFCLMTSLNCGHPSDIQKYGPHEIAGHYDAHMIFFLHAQQNYNTRSADLTALVSLKRLSKLLKFGGVALM